MGKVGIVGKAEPYRTGGGKAAGVGQSSLTRQDIQTALLSRP